MHRAGSSGATSKTDLLGRRSAARPSGSRRDAGGGSRWLVGHPADLDGDGDVDVITTDLNGDGRPDIVVTCDGAWANRKQVSKSEICWWCNAGR